MTKREIIFSHGLTEEVKKILQILRGPDQQEIDRLLPLAGRSPAIAKQRRPATK